VDVGGRKYMWIFNFKFQIVGTQLRSKKPGARSVESGGFTRSEASSRTPGIRHVARVLAVFCLLLFAYRSFAVGGRYEVREVRPNVFVWIPEDIIEQDGDPQFSRAATAGFIITREAVVVVNTTNSPFHARELLYEIRKRTEAPVKYVINTDAAGDHVLGNEVFSEQKATIISTTSAASEIRAYQQELARRLENDWRLQARMRGFHLTLPSQLFDGEMALLNDENELELVKLERRPGAPNAAVYLPRAKIVFLGDLFENGYFPRLAQSTQSRSVRGWIDTLRELESWNVDWYVPGHGAPGDKKQLAEFRQFLELLTNRVATRMKAGESIDQVKRGLIPFNDYSWHAPELASGAVEAIYQQLAGSPGAAPDVAPDKR
jgi:glyoxylase-like metal-dependent hydrolase (beta-lactamase superfamily II)